METIAIDAQCKMKVQLMKAQQGEMDAVILYRKLADLVDDAEKKKDLFKIAADEGKHAAILRRYTGEVLRAKEGKAFIVTVMYKLFGLNFVLKLLSRGEFKAAKEYSLFAKDFPNIKEIIQDEALHGELMRSMISH